MGSSQCIHLAVQQPTGQLPMLHRRSMSCHTLPFSCEMCSCGFTGHCASVLRTSTSSSSRSNYLPVLMGYWQREGATLQCTQRWRPPAPLARTGLPLSTPHRRILLRSTPRRQSPHPRRTPHAPGSSLPRTLRTRPRHHTSRSRRSGRLRRSNARRGSPARRIPRRRSSRRRWERRLRRPRSTGQSRRRRRSPGRTPRTRLPRRTGGTRCQASRSTAPCTHHPRRRRRCRIRSRLGSPRTRTRRSLDHSQPCRTCNCRRYCTHCTHCPRRRCSSGRGTAETCSRRRRRRWCPRGHAPPPPPRWSRCGTRTSLQLYRRHIGCTQHTK